MHNIIIYCDTKNKSQIRNLTLLINFIKSKSDTFKDNGVNLKILNSPTNEIIACQYNKLKITNINEIFKLIDDLTVSKKVDRKDSKFDDYLEKYITSDDSETKVTNSSEKVKNMLMNIVDKMPSESSSDPDWDGMFHNNIKGKVKSVKETTMERFINSFAKSDSDCSELDNF